MKIIHQKVHKSGKFQTDLSDQQQKTLEERTMGSRIFIFTGLLLLLALGLMMALDKSPEIPLRKITKL